MKFNLLHRILFMGFTVALLQSCAVQKPNVQKQFANAAVQASYMITVVDSLKANGLSEKLVAPRTFENGQLQMVRPYDWTSGFFAGELWFLYEQTRQQSWLAEARKFTAPLEPAKLYGGTHDLGFMMYCSFGNGYRLTGDTAYRSAIIQAAKTLSTRFNPKAGVIKSWDFASESKWKYPVIIDNMMNLELLFEVTKLTGDSSFYHIAVTHANTTMKEHYRPDYSSYHVIDYDPETGAVRQRITAQGFADASSWARGQAWGLYGYTMCYRETKDPAYLRQAENIANFMIGRLPADKVPFWDYDAPGIPNEPRDASAAAITASALYELASFTKNTFYRKVADATLKELAAHYLSAQKQNGGFILLHSTGHKMKNSEVDVPLIYADYYYMEALMRSGKK